MTTYEIGALVFIIISVLGGIIYLINDEYGFIDDMLDSIKKRYNDDCYVNTERKSSKSSSYSNTNKWGLYEGSSYVQKDGSVDHFTMNGDYSYSNKHGDDYFHYDLDGSKGHTHIEKDGSFSHYDSNNLFSGSSRPNSSGGVDHFDRWGLYTGSSDKE